MSINMIMLELENKIRYFKRLALSLVLFSGFLLNSSLVVRAQDAHFSQFYAAPLLLNPALAGTYTGTFRISTIYRDQWRSALDNPLRTFAASGDAKFDIRYGKRNLPDVVALGITFYGDRVTTFDYNTNQIVLTGAYHKLIDQRSKQYIGIGFQGGIFQRSVNYEDLTFQDQFNAIDGYTLGTGENLPPNNRSLGDLSLGVYYTISPSKNTNFHAGVGAYHVNRPNISFYNIPDIIDPNLNKTDILHTKWSIHTGASFKTSNRLYVQPRVNVLMQGPQSELNIGTHFRFKLSKTAGQYLLFGPYVRGVQNKEQFGIESLIALAGLELSNFIIGVSYDQSVGNLIRNRRSLSSLELSIIYIGEHNNEDNFCPQW
jgi:type IX secretion system PorP/SprF family membrane protein